MFIALLTLTVFAVFSGCIFWLLTWSDSRSSSYLKIKFKQFLTMYRINPDKWWLQWDGSVIYEDDAENIYQQFYFSPIDFLRYKFFYKKKKKSKKKNNNDKKWEKVVISWQKDINDYREKYTEELQNKIKEI